MIDTESLGYIFLYIQKFVSALTTRDELLSQVLKKF